MAEHTHCPHCGRVIGQPPAPVEFLPFRTARRDFERAYLRAVCQSVAWNMHRAAAILQMPRSNVYRKLGQLGIIKPEDPTHG